MNSTIFSTNGASKYTRHAKLFLIQSRQQKETPPIGHAVHKTVLKSFDDVIIQGTKEYAYIISILKKRILPHLAVPTKH